MQIIVNPERTSLRRTVESGTEEQGQAVRAIIDDVRQDGDAALRKWTQQLDHVDVPNTRISSAEVEAAYETIDDDVLESLQAARDQIDAFHAKQRQQSWIDTSTSGTVLGQAIRPLDRVGVYVPGGTAVYPSSVLMNIVPAKVAGVEQIVMMTPPDANGNVSDAVLVAADIAGVTEMYKGGGAQAIAALAYGTETIPAVDKIVGPGNIYVALAKKAVYGMVDIDKVAGPSEIVVLADGNQRADYIAADLLSQAEHDPLASAVCVTTSMELAEAVQREVLSQCAQLPRADIAEQSIAEHGAIYVCASMQAAVDVVNELAAEHVEVLTDDNPWQWLGRIRHAGAIFLGPYSTEPVGDYIAGPNHVLPTNGTARFSSPLSVDDFTKKSSIISYSKADLQQNADHIIRIARYEGLEGHAKAVAIRLEQEEEEGGHENE